MLVDETTPGTAITRCCLHCFQPIGDPHRELCKAEPGTDYGYRGKRLSDLNPVARALTFVLWKAYVAAVIVAIVVGLAFLCVFAPAIAAYHAVKYGVRKLRGVKSTESPSSI